MVPSTEALLGDEESNAGPESNRDDLVAFESNMDRTFQRFADRLAQNPVQVLRYEFPLLASKTDEVGRALSQARKGIPKCSHCGKKRVFEMQMMPHAITELEVDEVGLDGMEWSTILLAVCSTDCQPPGTRPDAVSYAEEWVGVQWE